MYKGLKMNLFECYILKRLDLLYKINPMKMSLNNLNKDKITDHCIFKSKFNPNKLN